MSLRFRVLGSGSTGNATLVEGGRTRVLIDAGLGPRTLAERLTAIGIDPATIDAVLVSHEHNDHARGVAGFSARWGARIVGTSGTYAAAGFGAGEIAGYDVLSPGRSRTVGALQVEAVPIPHDAAEPVAFVVAMNGAALGHATDLGHVSRRVADAFRDCTALLLESNYDAGLLRDGPYPRSLKERIASPFGHLSNEDAARYLERGLGSRCRRVILAHLSQQNNDPSIAAGAATLAMSRGGRGDAELSIAPAEGTRWIDVTPPAAARACSQMTLF